MELGSPKPKEGSRGENWARLSWVGSESSPAHVPHTELEKGQANKIEAMERCVGYSWPFKSGSGLLSLGKGWRRESVEEPLDR